MSKNIQSVLREIVADVTRSQVITTAEITKDVLGHVDLDRLVAGASLRTSDMTRTERAARKERLNDEARRKRNERAKVERSLRDVEHDAKADLVDDSTYLRGLVIVSPLVAQVDKTVNHFGHRFTNVIGRAHLHEVATKTLDDLARLVMTDDKHSPDIYAPAAVYVATLPGVPDVPMGAIKGASRLAQMLKRRARFNIIDWHRVNPTLDSIEHLTTIEANMHLGIDNLLARGCELHRNPFPLPGRTNTMLMRCIVDAAIESMTINGESIGWLADALMDEQRRDNVGRFEWAKHADYVLHGLGVHIPPIASPTMRAMYALKATQKAFSTLPDIVRETIIVCADPKLLGNYFGDRSYASRMVYTDTGVPTFEITNERKHVIIPEYLSSERLTDLYIELDEQVTPGQAEFRRIKEARVKSILKAAAEVPQDALVNGLQATLRSLMSVEQEQYA